MSFQSLAALQQSTPGPPGLWPTLALGTAGILTGLSAGIFTAFQVAVLPGLKHVPDDAFVSTFQGINRAIINPAFLAIYLGSPLVLAVATASWWQEDQTTSLWLGAALALQVANLAITAAGNVPLNVALDQASTVSGPAATTARQAFERPWRRLHSIRTVASVASTVAIALAATSAIRS